MSTAWLRLRDRVVLPKEEPRGLYLSDNDKTGHSINVPIPLTCHPTAACSKYCYGMSGPIAFPMSLVRQAQNWMRFEYLAKASVSEVNQEADRIAGAMLYAQQDFLRVFGVGDLQPGSVRFINALARRHPTLTLWVSTRRTDLVDGLRPAKNLHIMLSTDATTPEKELKRMRRFIQRRRPQAYLAFVQRSVDERPPKDAAVVFAEHKAGGRRSLWTKEEADTRTCPATINGGTAHTDACARCRFCFDAARRRTKTP